MRHTLPTAAFVALFVIPLACPATAAGQEPAGDSVPVEATAPDTLSTVYRAALQLQDAGEQELADNLFDYIVRHWPGSPEAEAIRARWAREGSYGPVGDGRTEVVVWGTLYGLWLGVAVPGMFGLNDARAVGAGLALGGPLGYLAASRGTRDTPIGDGAAEAITWGGTWGSWQGFGWAHVLELGKECTTGYWGARYCSSPSAKAVFGSMVALGLVGATTGALMARAGPISPGRATMASLGSVWGTWFGAAGAALLEVEDSDVAFGWTLMGGNLGLLAGAFARPGAPLSRNRVRLASIMGLAGGLAGVGLTLIMQPESDKLQIAIPLAGSIIGLAAGFGVTGDDRTGSRSDPDRSGPQGLSWELGGPVIPTVVDFRGERRPALNLTLLSARF